MNSVILYNDDDHEMIEVTDLIEKATGCDPKRSVAITLEAHKTGRAVVCTGSKEECGKVAKALTGLNVKVI